MLRYTTVVSVIFFVILYTGLAAQSGGYRQKAFTLGYNYNYGARENGERPPGVHFLEVGYEQNKAVHFMSSGWYVANDFGLNLERFVVGPKAGAFLGVGPIGMGLELCYYTDFHTGSLRFIPAFGVYTYFFNLTMKPHVVLTNKPFQGINKTQINLTIPLIRLRQPVAIEPRF